ncbi:MAG: hypothetical protein PVJ57_21720 [Phycisphaerae bacterium]
MPHWRGGWRSPRLAPDRESLATVFAEVRNPTLVLGVPYSGLTRDPTPPWWGVSVLPGAAMAVVAPRVLVLPGVLMCVPPLIALRRAGRRLWRRWHGRCAGCGYNLTGNVTGRCSECGETFASADLTRWREKRLPVWLVPYVAAGLASVGIWGGVSMLAGWAELWEDAVYWKLGPPLLLAANGLLGYAWPRRPWRWSVLSVAVLAVLILVSAVARGLVGLVPLAAFLGLALCIVCVAPAYAGAALRRARRQVRRDRRCDSVAGRC